MPVFKQKPAINRAVIFVPTMPCDPLPAVIWTVNTNGVEASLFVLAPNGAAHPAEQEELVGSRETAHVSNAAIRIVHHAKRGFGPGQWHFHDDEP